MSIRDEIEAILRGWDAYERARGANAVIDYDFAPADTTTRVTEIGSRLEAYELLSDLRTDSPTLTARLTADRAFLRALLGERGPLPTYLAQTQGTRAACWSADYVGDVGAAARESLAGIGIGWDAATSDLLEQQEGPLDVADAPEAIRAAAAELEPAVREFVGTDAPFALTVETADVDAYLGLLARRGARSGAAAAQPAPGPVHRGDGPAVRRDQILGHALQGASLSHVAANTDVPWVRILSVVTPQSTLFEGLAQAMPLFVAPAGPRVVRAGQAHPLPPADAQSCTWRSTRTGPSRTVPRSRARGCRSGATTRSATRSPTVRSIRCCGPTCGRIRPGWTGCAARRRGRRARAGGRRGPPTGPR